MARAAATMITIAAPASHPTRSIIRRSGASTRATRIDTFNKMNRTLANTTRGFPVTSATFGAKRCTSRPMTTGKKVTCTTCPATVNGVTRSVSSSKSAYRMASVNGVMTTAPRASVSCKVAV